MKKTLKKTPEEDPEEDPAKDLDNQLCPPADINSVLKYKDSAGSYLRGPYGAGSKATTKRKAQDQRERAKIASTCYSISALFQKQKAPAMNPPNTESMNRRKEAQKEIEDLLRLKTKVQEKFGLKGLKGATRRRYEMVRSFFWTQQKTPDLSRKQAALQVANAYNRGSHTAREVLKWERQWIAERHINPSNQGHSANHCLSMLDDEGTMLAAREYISSAGDGK